MPSYSLLKTIQGVKAEPGYANSQHSKRWTDLEHNLCPKRDMYDITGRGPLCADSLFAGSNGCVPVMQRVNAENDNRPKWSEYIARSGAAIAGDLYTSSSELSQTIRQTQRPTGGFGNISGAIQPQGSSGQI